MLQILRREKDGRAVQAAPRWPVQSGGTADVEHRSSVRIGLFGWSFILCVLVPAIVSFLYFAFLASDEYVSEAHFTIRAAEESRSDISDAVTSITATLGMGMGLGGRSTTQDVYIVADYIRSRSIIDDLGGKSVLFQTYSRPDIDWLSRLRPDAPLEKVWKYWQRKVSAIIDTPSSTISLEVQAFSAEEAHRLAEQVLLKSEALVNDISERSRRDALNRAKAEVTAAEDRLRKARLALLAFRNKENTIDPMANAKSISDNIAKLVQDRIVLQNNRAILGPSNTAGSPMDRVLSAQIASIDQQIANLQSQLTSQSKDTAISGQIVGYENLQIEVQFAEKLYAIAQASLEKARTEQEKQQLYVVTIDRPSMPEKATYPRILLDSVIVFAGCLVLWSMVTLLVASVRDHMGS